MDFDEKLRKAKTAIQNNLGCGHSLVRDQTGNLVCPRRPCTCSDIAQQVLIAIEAIPSSRVTTVDWSKHMRF